MQPWFIKEGDVIPFTKKDDKVVKLPNVGAYPNFLTGVADLQSRVKQGTLSNEMYKKLYTELLHRFMRRESAETPWFLQEFNDMPAGEYEGYELRVRKTGIKPPFVATAEIRKGYEIKGGGQTKEEAIDDVQKKIDDMKSTVATASGTTSLLFNAPFAHEMLKDPSTMDADLYMKIDVVDGKKVLVVGNNSEYTPEQLKAAGFSLSYDRRKQDKRLAGETTAMPMVNVSADTLNAMRLDANGIYQVNTDSPEKDDVGNTVYALQYLGRTSHGTKVRQPRPQFTIGTKTKMESAGTPWFLGEVASKPYLTGNELTKYRNTPKDRLPIFQNKIINSIPFPVEPAGEIIIPTKIEKYDNLQKFNTWAKTSATGAVPLGLKGYFTNEPKKIIDITIQKSNVLPKLQKTKEFSPTGKFAKGSKASVVDKINAQTIGLEGKTFKGVKSILQTLVSNPNLQNISVGRYIIDIAKSLAKGKNIFNLNKLSEEELKAIRDTGLEYLSIISMITNHAVFPNQNEFFKHIGLNSFNDMNITFPAGRSNPISDAVGTIAGFSNPVSGNTIWLSVKGGPKGKGAGWALRSLKIPDNLKKSKDYDLPIKTIELMQSAPGINEPFILLDFFLKNSIGTELIKEYSFNEEEIRNARTGKFTGSISNLVKVMKKQYPEEFKEGDSFRILHYILTQLIIKQLSKNPELTNITPLVREILQQNFLKIKNTITPNTPSDKNIINTEILWPNKELGSGTIEFFNKNSKKGGGTGTAFNKITIGIN
jgi:hypothetical protein